MKADTNILIEKIVSSFSETPNTILRYVCFDSTQDLYDVYEGMKNAHSHKGIVRFLFKRRDDVLSQTVIIVAPGVSQDILDEKTNETIDVLGKIIAGRSKYKSVVLLINDWYQEAFKRIRSSVKGSCPTIAWKWDREVGIVDTF